MIIRWFYNRSLLTKIITIVYSIVIITFLCLFAFLNRVATEVINENSYHNALREITYGDLLIRKEQTYLLGLASNYAISTDVQKAMHFSQQGAEASYLVSDILEESQYRMYALSLIFYNSEGQVIDYMSIDDSNEPKIQDPADQSSPFGRLINKRNGLPYEWQFIPQGSETLFSRDNSPKVVLWYLVKDNATKLPLGVITISLDSRKLLSTQSMKRTGENTIMLLHTDGTLVDGSGVLYRSLTDEERKEVINESMREGSPEVFPCAFGTGRYYVGHDQSSIEDCILVSAVREESRVLNDRLFFSTILGIILCLLILLPLFVVGTKFVTKPLNKLMVAMGKYGEGDSTAEVNFSGNDEIGRLGRIFNNMVRTNNELTQEKLELIVRKDRAELAAAQAQIDPHFLYNILNLIQWTALEKEEDELAELVNSTTSLIRYSLNKSVMFVTVGQEMDLVYRYLELRSLVLKNKLVTHFHVDKDALKISIPKLLIQPIIENSIKYGLRRDGSPITIEVEVVYQACEDRLYLMVRDDGNGISEDVLAMLPDNADKTSTGDSLHDGNKSALKNISDRLKIYYGEAGYVFNIESRLGEYTKTEIIVPSSPTAAVVDSNDKI